MLTKSFTPLLRIRIGGTTLKLTPNPHQKSIFPTYRSLQRLGKPKQDRSHLSTKIGDRWRLFRVDYHSPISLPPRAGPTHMSWVNSPPEHVAQGCGGRASVIKEIVRKARRKPTEIGWYSVR